MSKLRIDREKVLRRLRSLSEASVVIQRTARHIMQYYKSSGDVVSLWLEALNQAVSDQARTSLFYVANEILQSKSYGSNYFRQSWKPHLGRSIDLIKESSVNDKIQRILNIWIERKVYDKTFVEDLISRLSKSKKPVMDDDHCKDIIMNFEPEEAIEKLKELINVEIETSENIKKLESSITFDEKVCKDTIKTLKDKTHCNEFTVELDTNINQLFKICSMLEEELKVRQKNVELMANAEIYYETQQSETLIVEDAYRRYGNLISKTKDALEEHIEYLMDDGGQVDIDDAPSPGKTPPHLYEDNKKSPKNSPMSFDDVVSPSQSMDMSEDDTPVDKSSYLDKPYSPSHQYHSSSSVITESKPTLSSTEAFKLLTSVFSQSLTKKPLADVNTKVNLQSDIFRNTLVTSTETKSTTNDNKKEENSETVFADAFRLISNLTGLKTIGDRTFKIDSTTSSGTTIPILTSKMSYKSNDDCEQSLQSQYNYNQPILTTVSIANNLDNIPHLLYPEMQNTAFPPPLYNQQNSANSMFPMFNNTSVPPPPVPALFNALSNNPLAFTMASLNQNIKQLSKSPGSCTEDEDDGGATPTQDEQTLLNSSFSVGMFNPNVLPALAAGAAEINKQIQQAMNSGANPFNLSNMLSVQNEVMGNNPLQSSAWGGLGNQYSFNNNMVMPFSIINQSAQIQPSFTPVQTSALPFGPPRAIRTKRPNATDSSSNAENVIDSAHSTGSNSQSPPIIQPLPQCEDDSNHSDNQLEDLESSHSKDTHKPADNDSDVINLYGDVEEEIDRNYNLYQQNMNVRSSPRIPPSVDRYHLYNNQTVDLQNQGYYRNNDQHQNSPYNRPPRMSYQNSNFSRNQSAARGHMPYFPNRTTNFRPKNNYNMFN